MARHIHIHMHGPDDVSAFEKLEHKVAREPGVRNPAAVAAAAGIRKYGKAGMARKAAAGRRQDFRQRFGRRRDDDESDCR